MLAIRILVGLFSAVALLCVASLLMEAFQENPDFQRRRPPDNFTQWMGALALLVVGAVLCAGTERLTSFIFGSGEAGIVLGLFMTAAAQSGFQKLVAAQTACAELRAERDVLKLTAPLEGLSGADWKREFERLEDKLEESQKFAATRPIALRVLKEAVSQAQREHSSRRLPNLDLCAPELARLVGRRLSSLTVADEGMSLRLEFTDKSVFVIPAGEYFVSGKFYDLDLLADMKAPLPETRLRIEGDPPIGVFNKELRKVFLSLWDKAGTTHYVKDEWKHLGSMLSNLGMES